MRKVIRTFAAVVVIQWALEIQYLRRNQLKIIGLVDDFALVFRFVGGIDLDLQSILWIGVQGHIWLGFENLLIFLWILRTVLW